MSFQTVSKVEEANIVTHGGSSFHGDDVFGMALLELLLRNVRLIRLSHEEFAKQTKLSLKGKIVFDVGGGPFDHHQPNGNGNHPLLCKDKLPIPFASFGLLWESFGRVLLRKLYPGYSEDFYEYMYLYVEYNLTREIDAGDNGIFPETQISESKYRILSLPAVISLLVPVIGKDEMEEDLYIAERFAKRAILTILDIGKTSYQKGVDYLHMYGNSHLDKTVAEALRRIFKGIKYYKETKYYHYSEVENVWLPNCESYCFGLNPKHWQEIQTYVEYYINGLVADILRKSHTYPEKWDDIVCVTLGDIFKDHYYDDTFEQDLMGVFNVMFRHVVERELEKIRSRPIVEEAVKNAQNHIAVFDEQVMWQDLLFNNPNAKSIFFIVMPTDTGIWKVKPVPSKNNPTGFRSGFPMSFYGYQDTDHRSDLDLPGVKFIHPMGIIATCNKKEDALNLARISVEMRKPKERLPRRPK